MKEGQGKGNSAPFWVILGTIGIIAGFGTFVTALQQRALRRDFNLFTDHVMEAAFHLHRMALQIVEVTTDDLDLLPHEERSELLSDTRIVISAMYANVVSGKFDYFESTLGADHPEAVAAIRERLTDLNRSVPALLDRMRMQGPAVHGSADEGPTLKALAVTALRDSKKLNDSIRYAEALTFSKLRAALNRSSYSSGITIFFFTLITIGSLVAMKMSNTAAKTREAALRSAKDTAERLLAREREFLANTNHELRTPVSGLLGMAQLLNEERLSETAHVFAKNILSTAEDLSDLIGTVLDSHIEGAVVGGSAEWISISASLEGIAARYREKATERGLKFEWRDETVGREAFCPSNMLRSIVSAVLSNAVKFTDAGMVSTELAWKENALLLRFRDTGIGMDEETRARAGERFFQGENSYTKRHRGLGLGLWSAKRLVESLGGNLRIESSLGKGTTVEIELFVPTRSATGEGGSRSIVDGTGTNEREATKNCETAPTPTRPTIFIAEDDAINRMALEKLLARSGYLVLSASDGNKAMEAAREGNFHLAILDISMPYHTGIEVIKCIREREAKEGVPYVPAFALTGHSSAEDRRACLDAGFDEFITKPFNTVFLMDAIKNMIAAHPAVSSL